MIYSSTIMQRTVAFAQRAAAYDYPVLIVGESGTGKEGMANIIHTYSPRKDAPFHKVNCAAIPKELFEGEVFGFCRGAFTGAYNSKSGILRDAANGTVLLDEITEMPILLQAKLLRVLQEYTARALGENKDYEVKCRFIASCNISPSEAVRMGKLREDLLYRLSVIPILIPPLRDRRTEIGELIKFFFDKFNTQNKTKFIYDKALVTEAEALNWPGNIRQLENVIYKTIIFHGDQNSPITSLVLEITDMGLTRNQASENEALSLMEETECNKIVEVLRQTDGNKQKAAICLGIGRQTLYNKLKKYQITDSLYRLSSSAVRNAEVA